MNRACELIKGICLIYLKLKIVIHSVMLDIVRPGLLLIKLSLKDKCVLLSTPSIYESLNMTTTFQLLLDIYCTCIHCLTKLGVWYEKNVDKACPLDCHYIIQKIVSADVISILNEVSEKGKTI
jgi:hypothetical protein